jgi:hypothetical protein
MMHGVESLADCDQTTEYARGDTPYNCSGKDLRHGNRGSETNLGAAESEMPRHGASRVVVVPTDLIVDLSENPVVRIDAWDRREVNTVSTSFPT